MTFRTIHTNYGLQLMTQAEASGVPINLTEIAIGDGNGNPVEPNELQTNLVREVYRAAINRVFQDPDTPTRFTAELIVPSSEGGFVMREIGVFDSDGSLFCVGNLPDTYKPQASEGAYADTIIRVEFMVTNASVVSIVLDPSVAVASQQWVTNNITVCALLPGGTTGQTLRKASNGCGDTEWADPDEVNITVNSIEETQTLADAQTVVDWAVVNNTGLAVYVEGIRLRTDEYTKDGGINTRITLASAYPAGTKIVGAQNEPASQYDDPLFKSQNLADVANVATARTNLGIYSKAETDQKAPAGLVATFARNTAPTGWLKANGAAVSRAAYATLFAAIGTTFGSGDGFTTFNLPDLRGEFLRGWDDSRGVDSGRVFGSAQSGQNASHTHTGTTASNGAHQHFAFANVREDEADVSATLAAARIRDSGGENDYSIKGSAVAATVGPTSSNGAHTHTITTASSGGTEARPRNIALLACIKF